MSYSPLSYCRNCSVHFAAVKWGPKKNIFTTPELQLDELCALVSTLPCWKVVRKVSWSVCHVFHLLYLLFLVIFKDVTAVTPTFLIIYYLILVY